MGQAIQFIWAPVLSSYIFFNSSFNNNVTANDRPIADSWISYLQILGIRSFHLGGSS